MMHRKLLLSFIVLAAAASVSAAGEPDWFTRVRTEGLENACEVEVARYEKGVLSPSLHVGECYYELHRYRRGLTVFRSLVSSPDRNYAAYAQARTGEGLFHLGKSAAARRVFERCLTEHPDAWLDGSVATRCRAWLAKLAGRLESPDLRAASEKAKEKGEGAGGGEGAELARLRKEMEQLRARLAELKKLLRKLAKGGKGEKSGR